MSHTFTDTLLTKLGQQLHNAQELSAVVFRNGIETSLLVGITQLNTGSYQFSVPVLADWLPADIVSVHFTYRINDFKPTVTKVTLGSVLTLRASDVPAQIAQDVANQAAVLLVESTRQELRALAAEIAANQSTTQEVSFPAIPKAGFKSLSAIGSIAKISGATNV